MEIVEKNPNKDKEVRASINSMKYGETFLVDGVNIYMKIPNGEGSSNFATNLSDGSVSFFRSDVSYHLVKCSLGFEKLYYPNI